MADANRNTLSALLALTAKLNSDEMAVLVEVAEGLVKGREVYGPLDVTDGRFEYVKEAQDELRDFIAYAGMQKIKLRRLLLRKAA